MANARFILTCPTCEGQGCPACAWRGEVGYVGPLPEVMEALGHVVQRWITTLDMMSVADWEQGMAGEKAPTP
jgi:hypothetical protein